MATKIPLFEEVAESAMVHLKFEIAHNQLLTEL